MSLSSLVSRTSLRSDEGDKDDLSSHVHKLRYFTNSSDVFSSVFNSESKTLVESLSDDISIKDENLFGASAGLVEVSLHGFSKSRFTSSGETGEPVSASLLNGDVGRYEMLKVLECLCHYLSFSY